MNKWSKQRGFSDITPLILFAILLLILAIVVPNGAALARRLGYSPLLGAVVSGLLVCVVYVAVIAGILWRNARRDAQERSTWRAAPRSAEQARITEIVKRTADHYYLGIRLHKSGQTDDAIASFRKALELQPNHAGAHYELGVALEQKGERGAAQREFAEAERLNPDLKRPR